MCIFTWSFRITYVYCKNSKVILFACVDVIQRGSLFDIHASIFHKALKDGILFRYLFIFVTMYKHSKQVFVHYIPCQYFITQ